MGARVTGEQRAELQRSADVLGCDLLVIPEGCEEAFGTFLRAALGGGSRREGPPSEHRHAARWRMRQREEALAEAMLRPPDPAVVAELLGMPPR